MTLPNSRIYAGAITHRYRYTRRAKELRETGKDAHRWLLLSRMRDVRLARRAL